MKIVLDDVKVKYGEKYVLKGIGLSFSPKLNFVLGLNGSGKTTLLRCLSNSIPFEGSIWLDDTSLSDIPPAEFAKTIAIVHQKWSPPFRISIKDFVLMGRFPYLGWMGSYSQQDLDCVQQEMHRLKIDHLQTRSIDEVSGGELQRIFLCRALVQECPILLLDEPAQSLDPPSKQELYHLLVELAERGKTIICTTHDIAIIPYDASHCVGIREGKLVLNEPIQQALSPHQMQTIFAKAG